VKVKAETTKGMMMRTKPAPAAGEKKNIAPPALACPTGRRQFFPFGFFFFFVARDRHLHIQRRFEVQSTVSYSDFGRNENWLFGIFFVFHLLYLFYFLIIYPPANGANEKIKICVVSRGGNFFNFKKSRPEYNFINV